MSGASPQLGDAERLQPHKEARRLHSSIRYSHEYEQLLVVLIIERNAAQAALAKSRAEAARLQSELDATDNETVCAAWKRDAAALAESQRKVKSLMIKMHRDGPVPKIKKAE